MSETMRSELAKDMRATLDKAAVLAVRLKLELALLHVSVDRWSDVVLEERNVDACARMSRVNALLTDRSTLSKDSLEELLSDLQALSDLVAQELTVNFLASKGIST